ncbi:TetR family transcriptional regulator (plasmid) [Rathayibacter sp. VKM Ac-2803]|uniref:TetR/AcrR family transcriptional regulator n=1 Tax=Rathayibacter caricis DSM 15933 TaxID=1328867 RepID=A0A2T4UPB0_9MICO|nr:MULTISPECIES: TetR/AcrR family transcriptional regulator [Rathayibacter]MWV51538.1 TetR family transcriptional regulator [Rathayibacter sp. VKM Ac-2803]PTL71358.1 TetR/AcrR family transcriptional regulator [Rathayibacter caricis DSM 15933]
MTGNDSRRHARDADRTRDELVRAARRRFATEGYRAATVRGIASDAGVNVALISRYFGSKEGLFAACVQRSVDEMSPAAAPAGLDALIDRLIERVVRSPDSDEPLQMLLLLRSSGDEGADRIRRETLESFTASIAGIAGLEPGAPQGEDLMLRAQLAIATLVGLVMLRASAVVEPTTSATAAQLDEPLRSALRALLGIETPER